MPSSGDYIRDRAGSWLPTETKAGFIEQVNFVVAVYQSECQNHWSVYLETFTPAFLEFLVGITDFDEGDVLRFIFRPKGLKRGGHLKAGGLRRFAGKIAGLKQLQGRKYTNGVRNLWIFDTALQKLFFWWMVVDLVTQFVYRWTSLAFERAQCMGGSAARTAIGGSLFTLGGWQGFRFPTIVYDSPTVQAGTSTFTVISQSGFSSAAMSCTNTTKLLPCTLSLRVRHNGPGGEVIDQDQVTIQPGDSGTVVCNIAFFAPGSVVAEVRTQGVPIEIDSGDTNCYGNDPT